ncbi:hypothetical protein N7466_011569 [Penicillium verhagenii]|uniref:uncharacterized protein n=1 Tax=Penicillium verhagenii TaxID=1562060 RepID=UPI0025459119|nr:uncharacterized protein N7466_011569 [Penicillium verhagenii]KAJ5915636.1 hypothetical protein N7466_011569 [Penicillium verhagenii]
MDQLPTPFSPLQTSRPSTSDTSSPPSSRTTSPPSSPTSTFRHRARTTSRGQITSSPHHLFNLSFQPHQNQPSIAPTYHQNHDDHHSTAISTSASNDGAYAHPHAVSVLPCAVLRGRSSLMVIRRRPSAVELVLSEERSRCDDDSIERQGLDLMEPRPVEMKMNMNMGMSMNTNMHVAIDSNMKVQSAALSSNGGSVPQQQHQPPRYVMGGIFEVMEGRE